MCRTNKNQRSFMISAYLLPVSKAIILLVRKEKMQSCFHWYVLALAGKAVESLGIRELCVAFGIGTSFQLFEAMHWHGLQCTGQGVTYGITYGSCLEWVQYGVIFSSNWQKQNMAFDDVRTFCDFAVTPSAIQKSLNILSMIFTHCHMT